MLSRRKLLTLATGVGAAWLGEPAWFRAGDHTFPSTSGYTALAALCRDFRCPDPIAKACLRALPAIEGSPECLARLILAEMSSAGRDCTSALALRHAIREQSRHDFAHGKITNVEGWMLSLTETRVYALLALAELPGAQNERRGSGRSARAAPSIPWT